MEGIFDILKKMALCNFSNGSSVQSFSGLCSIRHGKKDLPVHPGLIVLFVFLLIILEILGNFLLFCIIFYEKFGMDSQKRTVTNQLLSKMTGVQILSNLFIIPSSFSLLPGLESKFLQLSFSEKITCLSVLVSVCLCVCPTSLVYSQSAFGQPRPKIFDIAGA